MTASGRPPASRAARPARPGRAALQQVATHQLRARCATLNRAVARRFAALVIRPDQGLQPAHRASASRTSRGLSRPAAPAHVEVPGRHGRSSPSAVAVNVVPPDPRNSPIGGRMRRVAVRYRHPVCALAASSTRPPLISDITGTNVGQVRLVCVALERISPDRPLPVHAGPRSACIVGPRRAPCQHRAQRRRGSAAAVAATERESPGSAAAACRKSGGARGVWVAVGRR